MNSKNSGSQPNPSDLAAGQEQSSMPLKEAAKLADAALEPHGSAVDFGTRRLLAELLQELPARTWIPRELLRQHGDTLALMAVFSQPAGELEETAVARLLFLIAFSKRQEGEENELSEFDFESSPWWRTFQLGLEEIGEEAWGDE